MQRPNHTTLVVTGPLVMGLAVYCSGCSSSSPRFRSEDTTANRIVQDDDEFRFASRIKEEVAREDDKKVDVDALRKKLSTKTGYSNITPRGLNRDAVLLDAVSYLGAPYKYGGNSKDGVDCSGFTCNVYSSAVKRLLPR